MYLKLSVHMYTYGTYGGCVCSFESWQKHDSVFVTSINIENKKSCFSLRILFVDNYTLSETSVWYSMVDYSQNKRMPRGEFLIFLENLQL